MFKAVHNKKGFTLIELMIVVVIIGILAALAIPRFMSATTKAKQSEAKGILKQVYTMQRTHFQAEGVYLAAAGNLDANWAVLGVEISDEALYTYDCTVTLTTFEATATANLDDDVTTDDWFINETGLLDYTSNDAID